MDVSDLHLFAGWLSVLAGILSGAVMGLCFHREDWAGGYGSFRRRMLRLGHISFFGIGLLNVLFAVTVQRPGWGVGPPGAASTGFLTALVAIPACCFLTAWRRSCRHLFPVPVAALLVGVGLVLSRWSVS